MRSLIEQAPPASPPSILVLAVETEASLEQNQFDSPTARQIVLLGLKHQYFTPEKSEFSRVILAARKKGVPLQQISSITMEVIQKGLSLQSLASRLQVTAGDLSHGPIVRPGISDGARGRREEEPVAGKRRECRGWSWGGREWEVPEEAALVLVAPAAVVLAAVVRRCGRRSRRKWPWRRSEEAGNRR